MFEMNLSFVYPGFLWLILVIPFLAVIALLGPQRTRRARFWSGLGLRLCLFLALIFSLAGVQIRYDPHTLTTVFLLDASDSISPEQRSYGEGVIRQAITEMKKGDQAAIILFGEDALVERLASEDKNLSQIASIPVTTRTDIASALQLAQAIFPGEGAKRMVLLSDGRENLSQAVEQAELAAASQIGLDYIPLGAQEETRQQEVWLDALEAPAEVREGQAFDLTAILESTSITNGSLRIFENNTLIQSFDLHLLAGSNRITIPIDAVSVNSGGSFRRYRAQILPDVDTRLQNNEASAFTIVQGPPTVLVVEGSPGEADSLAQVLRQAPMKVTQSAPANMPANLEALANYESIVLVDVPAAGLPPGVMDLLQVYVRDLGKGLVMVGGAESFGAGGYLRTPLEKTLPVDMDVRDKEIQSNLALILAVDKSGSMGRCHCDNPDLNQSYTPTLSGQAKVDIAKEAVMRSSAALGDQDYLGVIAFDAQPRWALEPTQHVDPLALENAISGIQANGQTNLQAGVTAAFEALQKVSARRKHIILMTDGWVRTGDLTNLAQEMRAQGITLSIVAAGEGSAAYLRSLATLGGGQFYPATNIQEVPDIFLKETIQSIGKYIIEEPFYPVPAAPSPVLRGLDPNSLPPLLGYNGVSAKKTSRLDLVTPRGDPLLASWQYGLGRSAVWTSDLKGQWAVAWMNWDGFGRFATQLVSWTLPTPRAEGLSIEANLKENLANVQVLATRPDGSPYNFLSGTALLIDPDLEKREIPLKQVGAGQYQAQAEVSMPGVYLIRVGLNDGDQSLGQSTLGLVVPYSPEYKLTGIDLGFLNHLAGITGGRELDAGDPLAAFTHNLPSVPSARQIWQSLLLMAALLFPIDVAIRRLSVNKKDLSQAATWFRSRVFFQRREMQASPRLLINLFEARQRARLQRGYKNEKDGSISPPIPGQKTSPEAIRDATPSDAQDLKSETGADDALARLREAKKRARR